MSTNTPSASHMPFLKDTVINGISRRIQCVEIAGKTFTISEGPIAVARLEDEWCDDIEEPSYVIDALRRVSNPKADLLTFWQRLPDVQPRYDFFFEWDDVAALEISTYEDWWTNKIRANARTPIRKAHKSGVVIREVDFEDNFIKGMVDIFNESPIRQGRRFWHYGKDFHTVKDQFSRYLFREQIFGAYFDEELIGFIFLADAQKYAYLGQILSKACHRDKGINNALIAKAVEVCALNKSPFLVYAHWTPLGSLSEFKERNGFKRIDVPRYFVPLTWRGKVALKVGLHRGWKAMVPTRFRAPLKRIRSKWQELRAR